jgi:hypothetical protein
LAQKAELDATYFVPYSEEEQGVADPASGQVIRSPKQFWPSSPSQPRLPAGFEWLFVLPGFFLKMAIMNTFQPLKRR